MLQDKTRYVKLDNRK